MVAVRKNALEKGTLRTVLIYTALACVINVIVFLVINKLDFIHYEMNDDFAVQSLLNGSMGGYYTHFQQINIAFNAMLAGLYRVIPAINWYGVFLFAALMVSASVTGGIILDKFGLRLGLPVYIASIPLFYGMILMHFTFTLVCYALMVCAFVSLVYGFYVKQKKLKVFCYVVSIVTLASSVLLRYEAVYSAIVYFGALALLMLIKYKKRALMFLLTVAVSFGAIGCFFAADNMYYASSEELSEYFRFNKARTNLVDKAPMDYNRYEHVFREVGWSQTDVTTFRMFQFPDDEKFSVENLEYIYDHINDTRYNDDADQILSNLAGMFNNDYVYMFICLFLFFAVAAMSQKKKLFKVFSLFLAVLPFLFQILFIVMWRGVFRVVYPHYMLSILALVMFVDTGALAEKMAPDITGKYAKNIIFGAMFCLVAVAGVGVGNMMLNAKWNYDERSVEMQDNLDFAKNAFENMELNPDKVFMYPAPSSPLLLANQCYGIFDTFEKDEFINIRTLGGWDTRSPAYYDFMERYGLEVLPRDLIDNDKVLIVLPSEYPMNVYINDTYGRAIEFEGVIPLDGDMIAAKVIDAGKYVPPES